MSTTPRKRKSSGLLLLLLFGAVWVWMVGLPSLGFFRLLTLSTRGIASALNHDPVGTSLTGFVWPVQGEVTSTFGLRQSPDGPGAEFHTGLDIAAAAGTPVLAAAAGRVVIAHAVAQYGNLVILEHQGPDVAFQTWYGHLSVIAVKAGDVVEQGHVIGLVGSTGRSTGPHLHFEYRTHDGRPRDPHQLYG